MGDLTAPSARTLGPAAELADDTRDYLDQSLARSTRRNYAIHIRAWERHCAEDGVAPYPADAARLANWLASRARHGRRSGRRHGTGSGQALGTVKLAYVALRVAHKLKGIAIADPNGLIEQTLRGIRRVNGSDQEQVAALRGATVVAVIERLGTGGPLEARDAALLSLGYIFARRRSELAGVDLVHIGPTGSGALVIGADQVVLSVRHHKTEIKEGALSITVPRRPNKLAIAAIERWIRLAGIAPGSPLLRRVRKNGRVGEGRLTPAAVAYIIKRRIYEHLLADGVPEDLARAEADRYSGHSLRHGFATTAAEQGADVVAIAKVTRHRGLKELRRYVEQADPLRVNAHNQPGVGIDRREE